VFIITDEPVYLLLATPWVSSENPHEDSIRARRFQIAADGGDPGTQINDHDYDVVDQMFEHVVENGMEAIDFSPTGNDNPLLELVQISREQVDLDDKYVSLMREGLNPIVAELRRPRVVIEHE